MQPFVCLKTVSVLACCLLVACLPCNLVVTFMTSDFGLFLFVVLLQICTVCLSV